jgi:hypothetical protein
MRRSELIFHPVTVSIFALLGVVSYVVWMRWRFPGGDLANNFIYVLPIIVPFVAFLFSRAQRWPEAGMLELGIDFLVVGTSMMRVVGDVPYVSGHALFLTYAIARPGSVLARVTATLVMIQVVYLKFFVWHDLATPVAGTTLGLAAAFFVRRLGPRRRPIGSIANVT